MEHEVEDYDEADYYVDDDGGVEEVDVQFLFGPLEEGNGEGGFHDGSEDYVNYFEEEDVLECVLVSIIFPRCKRWIFYIPSNFAQSRLERQQMYVHQRHSSLLR